MMRTVVAVAVCDTACTRMRSPGAPGGNGFGTT